LRDGRAQGEEGPVNELGCARRDKKTKITRSGIVENRGGGEIDARWKKPREGRKSSTVKSKSWTWADKKAKEGPLKYQVGDSVEERKKRRERRKGKRRGCSKAGRRKKRV